MLYLFPNDDDYDKEEVVDTVSNFLEIIRNTDHSSIRISVYIGMMDFLAINSKLLYDSPNFANTVRNKMHEFAITHNIRLERHYQVFFGEELKQTNELSYEQYDDSF